MKLIPIDAGNFWLDGGAMFGVVPKVVWSKHYPSDENNLCNWALRSLLIDEGDRKILIDTGMGNKQEDAFYDRYKLSNKNQLLASLKQNGYEPTEITDVILTHLHFDHVGGAITQSEKGDLVTSFPNAKYWVSKSQWEWATHPNPREKASFLMDNILPIQECGQLKLIGEEFPISENIYARIFNGHTIGQIIPYIKYKGKTIAFMADLLPSVAHIPLAWIMSYDVQPLQTLEDRKRFYKEAIQDDMIIFLQHDLLHEACRLQETPKGVRVKDTFTLQEFFK
ncbi:MAG: MBL fold metallo-hydrolase [Bacteroidales bacterium]